MKKFLSVILAMLMLAFVACSGSEPSSSTAPTPTPTPAPEKAVIGKWNGVAMFYTGRHVTFQPGDVTLEVFEDGKVTYTIWGESSTVDWQYGYENGKNVHAYIMSVDDYGTNALAYAYGDGLLMTNLDEDDQLVYVFVKDGIELDYELADYNALLKMNFVETINFMTDDEGEKLVAGKWNGVAISFGDAEPKKVVAGSVSLELNKDGDFVLLIGDDETRADWNYAGKDREVANYLLKSDRGELFGRYAYENGMFAIDFLDEDTRLYFERAE